MAQDTTSRRTLAGPLDGALRGLLRLETGATRLQIVADPSVTGLYRASLREPLPGIDATGGRLSIRYRSFSRLTGRAGDDEIALNPTIPWEAVAGSLANVGLDLSLGRVASLSFGSVNRLAIRLPEPDGMVPIKILGSARNLTIRRPEGTPVRVRIGGSATHADFDSSSFPAIGSATSWQSHDFSAVRSGYDVQISGSVATLRVTTS